MQRPLNPNKNARYSIQNSILICNTFEITCRYLLISIQRKHSISNNYCSTHIIDGSNFLPPTNLQKIQVTNKNYLLIFTTINCEHNNTDNIHEKINGNKQHNNKLNQHIFILVHCLSGRRLWIRMQRKFITSDIKILLPNWVRNYYINSNIHKRCLAYIK